MESKPNTQRVTRQSRLLRLRALSCYQTTDVSTQWFVLSTATELGLLQWPAVVAANAAAVALSGIRVPRVMGRSSIRFECLSEARDASIYCVRSTIPYDSVL
jgi:hypothetical protein